MANIQNVERKAEQVSLIAEKIKKAQSIVATRSATTIHINGSDGTMSLDTPRVAGTVGPGTPAPARTPGFSYNTMDRTLLVRSAETLQSFKSDQAGCLTLRLTRSACQVAPDSRR